MTYHTEWSPDLVLALAAPFPPDVVQQKQKGGTKISFVPWHFYVRKLNDLVGPGWSMGTPILHDTGGKLVMGIPVTILGVTRINFGDEEEEKDNYGTAVTGAFAQSFKRTLALFGMGLDMYLKPGQKVRVGADNVDTRTGEVDEPPLPRCPQCSGSMRDNRPKKRSGQIKATAPDLGCLNRDCQGAYWKWPPPAKASDTQIGELRAVLSQLAEPSIYELMSKDQLKAATKAKNVIKGDEPKEGEVLKAFEDMVELLARLKYPDDIAAQGAFVSDMTFPIPA